MSDNEKGMIQGLCLAAVYLIIEGERTLALELLKQHGINEVMATTAEVDTLDYITIFGKSYAEKEPAPFADGTSSTK